MYIYVCVVYVCIYIHIFHLYVYKCIHIYTQIYIHIYISLLCIYRDREIRQEMQVKRSINKSMYTRMIDIDLYMMLGGMGGGDTNMNMFGPVFQQLMQQQMHQQMNHQPQQHTPTQPQQSRTPQPQPPPQPPQPPPHAQQGVPNMFATGSAPGMASAHQQAAAAAAAAAARATGGIGGMHMPAAMQDMIQNQIQQQMAANGMPSFGGMHVHMTVNGESVPMPPMPGTAPGGMPSMSGSGAPGGMPMPMPGMPGEVPGGDEHLLGAASVFQQLMQMQQQQQQRQQQGQPSPTPPSAPPPHAPAHPQQPPPNMHFGAANLPSGFEQIQQQIHQQATAAAAAAVAGAGLQMSPDMQEMIQSQIQQQLQGMGMQGMPMPPHGGPQQPPHHPRNAPVPAQEPQMATFVNAGGPGIICLSVSLSLCLSTYSLSERLSTHPLPCCACDNSDRSPLSHFLSPPSLGHLRFEPLSRRLHAAFLVPVAWFASRDLCVRQIKGLDQEVWDLFLVLVECRYLWA